MIEDTAASSLGWLWIVPGAPLAAFAVIGLMTLRFRRLSAAISILAISCSFVFSLGALMSQLDVDGARVTSFTWLKTDTLLAEIGLLLDPLSAVMLVVVTSVALMVQLYSIGYMAHEKAWGRYYAYMSLFCFSMLGLVLANNFVQLFICWELVGACSYLLIGFYYDQHAPAFAAKKAFVTTRFGDLGFLIGLIMLCGKAGSFDFAEIRTAVSMGSFDPGWLAIVAVLLFCGAVGKSAQIPLHVWLPDAMEGPAPVSALIHAATMVAAGVFMVARLFFLFEASPNALLVVAVIGGVTAIFAATIALVQDDIKRVLAYSTISQLGYMMLALGVGGMTAGMFHLFTHAFFKALLFLGAGAIIHATHTNDIWQMGGLRKKMPWTFWTFVAGSLALAGIFPFAGFYSKDLILHQVMGQNMFLFTLAILGSLCTAFYMGRVIFVAFLGEPRSAGAQHAHEVPWVMRGPLVALAVMSVTAGFWMNGFFRFFGSEAHFEFGFAAIIPFAGIVVAYLMYVRGKPAPDALAKRFEPAYVLLKRRYFVDEAYDWLIDNLVMKVSAGIAWFDRHVVDGAVNGVAWMTNRSGSRLRYLQTGQVQNYALVIFGGVIVLLMLARMSGAH